MFKLIAKEMELQLSEFYNRVVASMECQFQTVREVHPHLYSELHQKELRTKSENLSPGWK